MLGEDLPVAGCSEPLRLPDQSLLDEYNGLGIALFEVDLPAVGGDMSETPKNYDTA